MLQHRKMMELILESNLINFVIAFAAVAYLLIKVIPEATKNRKSEIQKELIQAQEAKEAAEAKLKELEAEIENAKKDSVTIVENAKANAEAIKTQTIQEAKEEIDRLNANSQREIEMHKEMAINTIKEQIAQLTMKNVKASLLEKKEELDKLIKVKLKKDLKETTV